MIHAMKPLIKKIQHELRIPLEAKGQRIDQVLAKLLPEYSRVLIQNWLKSGKARVNQKIVKAKMQVLGGENIQIEAELEGQSECLAQALPLNIVFEDEEFMVINKPVGLVVHPGSGNRDQTLVNALLHHNPDLNLLPRAGLIHRLDKDTSGLLLIAKTLPAYHHLNKQLKARSIRREYQALVSGTLISGGTIDAPLARHPLQRKRMTVIDTGRSAITHFRLLEKFRAHTLLKLRLETGRTHQIRVHLAYRKHPILGDATYGERLRLPKGATVALIQTLQHFKHQALHADELGLLHPLTQEELSFKIELPEDFQQLLRVLHEDTLLFKQQSKNG